MVSGRPKVNISYLEKRAPSWCWRTVVEGKDWRYVGEANNPNQQAEMVVVFLKDGTSEQELFSWISMPQKL
jgi:hypothetical protein